MTLHAPIAALEQTVAKAPPADTLRLEKEAIVLEESLMKILLQLDTVQGDAYREQRRASVKEAQVWVQRVDAVKKTLADRKAAM